MLPFPGREKQGTSRGDLEYGQWTVTRGSSGLTRVRRGECFRLAAGLVPLPSEWQCDLGGKAKLGPNAFSFSVTRPAPLGSGAVRGRTPRQFGCPVPPDRLEPPMLSQAVASP